MILSVLPPIAVDGHSRHPLYYYYLQLMICLCNHTRLPGIPVPFFIFYTILIESLTMNKTKSTKRSFSYEFSPISFNQARLRPSTQDCSIPVRNINCIILWTSSRDDFAWLTGWQKSTCQLTCSTCASPFSMKANWRRAASRNVGSRQKQMWSCSSIFSASCCAYSNAQLSVVGWKGAW